MSVQEEYKKKSHDHAQRGLYWGYGIVAVVSDLEIFLKARSPMLGLINYL